MPNIVYGGYGSFCFCLRSRRCAERSSCDESVEIVVGLPDPKLHFQRIFVFLVFLFVTDEIVLVYT